MLDSRRHEYDTEHPHSSPGYATLAECETTGARADEEVMPVLAAASG